MFSTLLAESRELRGYVNGMNISEKYIKQLVANLDVTTSLWSADYLAQKFFLIYF